MTNHATHQDLPAQFHNGLKITQSYISLGNSSWSVSQIRRVHISTKKPQGLGSFILLAIIFSFVAYSTSSLWWLILVFIFTMAAVSASKEKDKHSVFIAMTGLGAKGLDEIKILETIDTEEARFAKECVEIALSMQIRT